MRQVINQSTQTKSVISSRGFNAMSSWAKKALWCIAALMISFHVQADTYYFHNDHLGTPQVLTDNTQQVVWKGEYDPFGKCTETVNLVEQNLRFPGQYFDQETGLHYNYKRTYDPKTGRYVESDPIGLVGGLSTYGYTHQNPIRYTDPTGEFVPALIWGAIKLYAAIEIGLFAYDAYNTVQVFTDECATVEDKALISGLFLAGMIAPGGGSTHVAKGAANPKVKAALERGREAHREFAERVKAKEGWVSEPQNFTDPATGRKVIPDAVTPSGRPVELKPNTPSGRRQGRRQLIKYERATGKKGKVVYYDP